MPVIDGIDIGRRAAFPAVLDAWRAMVTRHATRPAVECAGDVLTYAELDRAANRFAQWLIARGGDAPIALVAAHEPASLIALLGTLKTGRVFVPLDPRDTPERIRAACDRVGADLVPDDAVVASAAARGDDPGLVFGAEHPSLIYFSSGSTGVPCAGLKTHGLLTMPLVYGFEPDDRCGLVLPLAFGATIGPMFGALCSGATVCIFDPVVHGVPAMADWLDRDRITIVGTAPSVLRAAAAALDSQQRRATHMRRVTIGGEPMRLADLEVIRRVFPAATIVNHYGATEASFVACSVIAPDTPLDASVLPFRTVFPDQRVTIVDEHGIECPTGTAGEIVVSGGHVALRYWGGHDEQSRWTEVDGVRTFYTRDRGRFLPDGSLEHLGRMDDRVKVHGQSVDIAAVERALRGIDGVADAAVAAAADRDGRPRLVAYIAPTVLPGPGARELRTALAAVVPPFMIPASFVRLKTLPLTDRGKVNRALLAAGAVSGSAVPVDAAAGGEPRTPAESELAQVIAAAFGAPRVGVDDDFFDLGLDSLSVHAVIDAVERRWGVPLTPRDFVEAPTVAALAPRLGTPAGSKRATVFSVSPGGRGTPLYFVPWSVDAMAFGVRRLAIRLDRPAFVLAMSNDDDRGRVSGSVRRTAEHLVETLTAAVPDGPLILGGHSFGALVALEMARQLTADGRQPALLVLVEPVSGARNVAERFRKLMEPTQGPTALARRVLGSMRRNAARQWATATADVLPLPAAVARRVMRQADIANKRRYRPQPYAGRVLLVRTPEWRLFDRLDLATFLTGDCRVVPASGDHISLLFEPHVTALARAIRDAVDAVDDASR